MLTLKDGSKVEGAITQKTGDSIVLKLKFGTATYAKSEIKEIKRSAAPECAGRFQGPRRS